MKIELIQVFHPCVLPFVWFAPMREPQSGVRYYKDTQFGREFWDWRNLN